MEDAELVGIVRSAVEGDDSAWEALVHRFAGLVWAVARGHSLSEEDAADVSQTTWTRLAETMRTIREPHRIGAWLATTARRESLRLLRSQKREARVATCVEADRPAEDGAAAPILEKESRDELWEAFEALSGPCKALLRALLAEPAPSYAELSNAFDMPIGSIGPTRARCLDRLRHRVALREESPSGTPVAISHRRRVS